MTIRNLLWRYLVDSLLQASKQQDVAADFFDLPPKPPRSKLEPHRELIRSLRRGGHTYRDISGLFLKKLKLEVAPSTIHSFVKVRARHKKVSQFELPPLITPGTSSASHGVQPLRSKPQPEKHQRPRFEFRENEPLTLTNNGGTE
jgi:hypothetical protein